MDSNFLIQALDYLENKWTVYLSPFVFVRSYESGVLLLLGKYRRTLKTGINWKFPYPFNEAHTCLKEPETIHAEVTITTSDNKTLNIKVIGEYEITDPRIWILEANDAATNIKDLLEGYSADILVDSTSEEINKKGIKTKIKNKLNEEVSTLGARFNRILFSKNVITKSISLSGLDQKNTNAI